MHRRSTPIPVRSLFVDIVFMIVILVALIAMMWWQSRKAKQQQQERKDFRENLQPGTEIITIGGIIGRIVSIKDDTIVIETAGDRSKIRLARWSIQQNITATERAAQEQAANKENKK